MKKFLAIALIGAALLIGTVAAASTSTDASCAIGASVCASN